MMTLPAQPMYAARVRNTRIIAVCTRVYLCAPASLLAPAPSGSLALQVVSRPQGPWTAFSLPVVERGHSPLPLGCETHTGHLDRQGGRTRPVPRFRLSAVPLGFLPQAFSLWLVALVRLIPLPQVISRIAESAEVYVHTYCTSRPCNVDPQRRVRRAAHGGQRRPEPRDCSRGHLAGVRGRRAPQWTFGWRTPPPRPPCPFWTGGCPL